MFTMKKLALISAAGLAALSISCSDESSDPGGTATAPALGTVSAGGIYPITGTITANAGNFVTSVTVSGGSQVTAQGQTAITGDVAEVTLASLGWKLVPDNCGTAATASVTLTVKATFSDGEPVEVSGSPVTVNCIAPIILPTGFAASGEVTLGGQSGSVGSFLDIDTYVTGTGYTVYTIGTATANKDKIDLLYDGTNLWTPAGVSSGSFGSTQLAGSTSDAWIWDVTDYPIPANVTVQELIDFASSDEIDALPVINSVAVKAGGRYLVVTSEMNLAVVFVGPFDTISIKLAIGRADLEE